MGGNRSGRAALALLAALASACASSKPSVVTTTSLGDRPAPAWVTKPPLEDADGLIFLGNKEDADTQQAAQDAATDAARARAAQYIGVEIKAEHTDVQSTSQADNNVRAETRSRATALIRSAQVLDSYWVRHTRTTGTGTLDSWDSFVLIRLPKAELQAERDRQAREAKASALAAASRLREADAAEKAGDLLGALSRYRDAQARANAMNGSQETGDAEFTTASAVAQRAQDAAARVQSVVRRALLVAPDVVAGGMTQALAKAGFTALAGTDDDVKAALAQARAQGLPWVIVAKARTSPGGKVFSKVAATAQLDVRALDARTGAVVVSAQQTDKGFGNTAESAGIEAQTKAAALAGKELAKALAAKENESP